MKTIKLEVRNVYGRPVYYPGCPFSKLLCELLNQRSLTATNLDILEKAGYSIDYQERSLKEGK